MSDWWIDEEPYPGPYQNPIIFNAAWVAEGANPIADLIAFKKSIQAGVGRAIQIYFDEVTRIFDPIQKAAQSLQPALKIPPAPRDGGVIHNTGPRPVRAYGRSGRKQF